MDGRRPIPDLQTVVRLLNKARAEEVTLSPVPRSSVLLFARRDGSSRVYVVGPDGCTCPAGLHGTPCKHWALYIYEHLTDYAEEIVRMAMESEGEHMTA